MDMVEFAPAADPTTLANDEASLVEAGCEGLHLDLWLRDPEVVSALQAQSEGRRRDDYARTAIRIGILALQQAQGRIDTDSLRREGEHLIAVLENRLSTHQLQLTSGLGRTLQDYFDPAGGRFTERVERLVKKDGDLERVIGSQMDAMVAALKQSLEGQVGPSSALSRLLTPSESNALLQGIRNSVDELLHAQRDRVLSEFSLDNRTGALFRLLDELTTKNGRFTGDLKESVAGVVAEFSLDKEDSALSRLVKRVEEAQRQINAEFTLDSDPTLTVSGHIFVLTARKLLIR